MKNKQALCLSLCLSIVAACAKSDKGNSGSAGNRCFADTVQTVSFERDIMPIFGQNCSLSGCHTGSSPTGGLNLDAGLAYQDLMKPGTGYIDTTDPSGSLLYSQLLSVSTPMPPAGKLDPCSIKLILKWITQKAPNN